MHESYQKIRFSLNISWEPGSQVPREFAALGVIVPVLNAKGVQLIKINWQELPNFLKNVEEHPPKDSRYWMLSYIFQYVSVQ